MIFDEPPVALAQSVGTDEDVPVSLTLTGTDDDGDLLAFTVVAGPVHGALSGSGAGLTYTPIPDFSGTDAFTFVANDGTVDSVPAAVSLTVTPVDEPTSGGCGCSTGGETAPAWAVRLGMLTLRRRRAAISPRGARREPGRARS